MILRNITVVNFGAVKRFSCEFENGVNYLKTRHTKELSYAVQLVSNHKGMPPLPQSAVRADSQIEAIISIEGNIYRIIAQPDKAKKTFLLQVFDEQSCDVTAEYLFLTDHCEEQDRADVFIGTEREMPLRILQYANEELYFPRNELHRLTGKMSSLKAFRAYLKAFIKRFEPQVIRAGKLYEFTLKNDGCYGVRYKNADGMPICLSESEQILFRYLCFLRTAEFWQGFEELRNIHGVNKPILIGDFLERLDESIDMQDILERTKRLNRQVIMLTT